MPIGHNFEGQYSNSEPMVEPQVDSMAGSAIQFALRSRVELRINAPHGKRIRITAISSRSPFGRATELLPISALSEEIDLAIRNLIKEVLPNAQNQPERAEHAIG